MARALAGACARASPKPVAFFARKGADCLGKFAGDAERTLRLLFQEVTPNLIENQKTTQGMGQLCRKFIVEHPS